MDAQFSAVLRVEAPVSCCNFVVYQKRRISDRIRFLAQVTHYKVHYHGKLWKTHYLAHVSDNMGAENKPITEYQLDEKGNNVVNLYARGFLYILFI
jgi:hypothetical protein